MPPDESEWRTRKTRIDARLVGIVEAKRRSLGPQNVLVQAQRYSRGISDSPHDFDGYRVPFLYSTLVVYPEYCRAIWELKSYLDGRPGTIV